jgi:hypothetical protein
MKCSNLFCAPARQVRGHGDGDGNARGRGGVWRGGTHVQARAVVHCRVLAERREGDTEGLDIKLQRGGVCVRARAGPGLAAQAHMLHTFCTSGMPMYLIDAMHVVTASNVASFLRGLMRPKICGGGGGHHHAPAPGRASAARTALGTTRCPRMLLPPRRHRTRLGHVNKLPEVELDRGGGRCARREVPRNPLARHERTGTRAIFTVNGIFTADVACTPSNTQGM